LNVELVSKRFSKNSPDPVLCCCGNIWLVALVMLAAKKEIPLVHF
jgi:hypothetical protein